MRILWLPLTLLLTSPSWAADKTVLIPLHHVPAVEIERRLFPGGSQIGAFGETSERESGSLVPHGVTAWTVDQRRNGLSVTGTDQGIRAFREIIDLIDVPARSIRLSVRVVRLDARDISRFEADPLPTPVPDREPALYPVAASPEQVAALEARKALAAAELTVANNLALHLSWPGSVDEKSRPADILPRVNGDGTVTLYLPRSQSSPARTPGTGETLVMRRVAPGQGVVIFSRTLGTALIVKVREVLPDAAKPAL